MEQPRINIIAAASESSQRAVLAKHVFLRCFSLAKPDVFCTKIFSHNPPWQVKNVFSKKISEIFDLFFFFPGFLARDKIRIVFCKKISKNIVLFPLH